MVLSEAMDDHDLGDGLLEGLHDGAIETHVIFGICEEVLPLDLEWVVRAMGYFVGVRLPRSQEFGGVLLVLQVEVL